MAKKTWLAKCVHNVFFITTCIPIIVQAQTDTGFVLNGYVKGWQADKVYLYQENFGELVLADSAMVINDHFVFVGRVKNPVPAMLAAKTDKGLKMFHFFIENSNMQVTGKYDSIKYLQLTGSATNNQHNEISQGHRKIKAIKDSFSFEGRGTTPAEQAFAQKQMDSLNTAQQNLSKSFIRKYPSSILSLRELGALLYTTTPDTLLVLYNELDTAIRNSEAGKNISIMITSKAKLQVNKPAPDFLQKDSKGKPIQLSKYKGKYVLLDFWASWCVPCRKENPTLVALYKKYKNQKFEIISVSLDDSTAEKEWRAAIVKDKLTWPQVADLKGPNNAIGDLYAVASIPANFLIDPNGIIIEMNLRGEELSHKLQSIFKQ